MWYQGVKKVSGTESELHFVVSRGKVKEVFGIEAGMDDLCLRIITRIRAEAPRLKCRDLKKKCDEYIAFFTKQVEEKGMAKRDEHRAGMCSCFSLFDF